MLLQNRPLFIAAFHSGWFLVALGHVAARLPAALGSGNGPGLPADLRRQGRGSGVEGQRLPETQPAVHGGHQRRYKVPFSAFPAVNETFLFKELRRRFPGATMSASMGMLIRGWGGNTCHSRLWEETNLPAARYLV